jgi:hypothetical protein
VHRLRAGGIVRRTGVARVHVCRQHRPLHRFGLTWSRRTRHYSRRRPQYGIRGVQCLTARPPLLSFNVRRRG